MSCDRHSSLTDRTQRSAYAFDLVTGGQDHALDTGIINDLLIGSEAVGGHQHIRVRADKLLPGRRGLTLWSWRTTMALEDVTHRLVTEGILEVGQGADDPVVAPGAILLCHTDDQRLQLLVDPGTPWGLALLRTVKLLGYELTVP